MSEQPTDVALGVTILFALAAGASVVLTYVAPNQSLAAVGFGGAVLFGSLLLVAQHWSATAAAAGSH